jgi:uncharacterized membrane protein
MRGRKEWSSSTAITWVLGLLSAFFGLALAREREMLGFASGGLIGVLLAQIFSLRQRTRDLRNEIDELRESREIPIAPAALKKAEEAPAQTSATPQPSAPIVPRSVPIPRVTAPSPAPDRAAAPLSQTPRLSPKPPAEIPFIAWLKGGNPFARLGIAILFIAGVLTVKYAAEHSMFPVELRFALIAVAALALLVVGWRLREKRSAYAHLLQGGGIAGLYLTIFSATRFFQLLPFGLALALLVVVAVAAAILAVAQDTLPLAFVATAGGFLAPVLLSTGGGNYVALFTYYAILNLGVFIVAWFRAWRPLNVLGFIFTFTITGLWRATGYHDENLWSADAFLILFFVMYVGVSILNCLRQPPDLKGYVSASLVFGLPVVAFTLHATLLAHIEYALAWSALALGAAYLMLAFVLYLARNPNLRLLIESFAALGVIFATLTVPLAFDTHTTAAMWAVEGAGTVWFGVRQQRKLPRFFGVLMQLLGGVSWAWNLSWPTPTLPILNSAYLGTLLLTLGGFASGLWLYRNREKQASYEMGWSAAAALWALAWWLFGGLHEIDRSTLPEYGAALSFVAATAAVWALIARALHWPFAGSLGRYLPSVAMIFALVYATDRGHPSIEWGTLGWLLLLAAHYALMRRQSDATTSDASPVESWLHAFAAWVIVIVVMWEGTWQVDRQSEGVWAWLVSGLVPAIAIALIARRNSQAQRKHRIAYLLLASIPLVVWCAAWIVVVSVTNNGDPAPLPYLPLLNPLDVSVMLAFASGTLWCATLTADERQRVWSQDIRSLLAIIAALAFLWLNSALIRSMHYLAGAPLGARGIMRSVEVQAALSVFWGLLGFTSLLIAGRKGWRPVWLIGATLMGIVIAKLFLIDFAGRGTLARIVSFVTVGALLLVTGYLSPLPPRAAEDKI